MRINFTVVYTAFGPSSSTLYSSAFSTAASGATPTAAATAATTPRPSDLSAAMTQSLDGQSWRRSATLEAAWGP